MIHSFCRFVFALVVSLEAAAAGGAALFSESYADRVAIYREPGGDGEPAMVYADTYASGQFSLRGKYIVNPGTAAIISAATTPVSLVLGAWSFQTTLGADPNFTPGKKSASFKFSGGSVVKIAWSKTALTWSVSGKTGMNAAGDSFGQSPAAAGYAGGEQSGAIYSGPATRLACSLSVGSADVSGAFDWVGVVKKSIKRFGSGENTEELELCSVNLKGACSLE